jgi:DNA-binding transcriptional MerR regulator
MKSQAAVYYVRFGGPGRGVIGCRPARDATSEREGLGSKRTITKESDAEENGGALPGLVMSDTYSYKDVSRLFNVTEGRLRYWDRSGFISPTGHDGRRRCYTFQDLVGIRSAMTLLEKGISVQRARRIVGKLQEEIPRSAHPLGRLRIIGDSKTVVVTDAEREYDVDSGQMLIDFSVKELEKEIAELPDYREKQKSRTAYEWYLEGCRYDEAEETMRLAEEAYYRAIHLDPTLANSYTNLGNLLYRTGAEKDAKALYEKAIEVDNNQPEAHYNLGFLEFEDNNMEIAAECFTRAIELDSTFSDAHFNLAITVFRLGDYDRARYHLKNYLKLEPAGPWADIARKRLAELK